MKKRIPLIMAAAVIAAAVYLYFQYTGNESSTVYYGTAEADKVDISAEVAGRLKDIKVDEGGSVKPGTVVALLDTPENAIKAEQSETSIKSAENELAKLNEGSRQEEIDAQSALTKQAAAAVKQAENAREQAGESLSASRTTAAFKKKLLDDAKKLFQASAISQQELDNAQYAYDNAASALANAAYASETAGQQVNAARDQLQADQAKLDLLKNGATDKTKTGAQYGIDQAKQSYDLAKLLLDKANLVSLSDGVVDSVNYSVGEYVTPGSPVVTIVNPKNMWVKIFVPEEVLPKLKVNRQVGMKSDFIKGETIKGKIAYIATEAEFTPTNTVTKKDRMRLVFAVKVKILDHLDAVRPGMLLDVDLGPIINGN